MDFDMRLKVRKISIVFFFLPVYHPIRASFEGNFQVQFSTWSDFYPLFQGSRELERWFVNFGNARDRTKCHPVCPPGTGGCADSKLVRCLVDQPVYVDFSLAWRDFCQINPGTLLNLWLNQILLWYLINHKSHFSSGFGNNVSKIIRELRE